MGANLKENVLVEDEEEYVFLDLSGVCGQTDIPANAPYVLSGLDTLNPVLVIGNKLKLMFKKDKGQRLDVYTIKATIIECSLLPQKCYGFSLEELHSDWSFEAVPIIGEYEETIGTCFVFSETVDPNQASTKEVKPIARLHKTLKFRLLPQDDNQK